MKMSEISHEQNTRKNIQETRDAHTLAEQDTEWAKLIFIKGDE